MGRRRVYLALIDLEIMALTDSNNAIFKDGGPEIPNMKNFMCSSITRHVTATGTTVTIIQGLFILLESQTPAENGINSDAVECISDYAIGLRLMMDASASILHQLRSKGGSTNIYDDITVPRIEGANQKTVSSEMRSSEPNGAESEGREQIKSAKPNDFFELAVVKSKSNSWRMKIHFDYFPPNN